MSEHVTWEATLPEVVDAHLRAFSRTRSGRRARYLIPAIFGVAVGVFVALARPATIGMRVGWGLLWGTASAVIFITMFRRSLKRRLSQHLKAQLGESPQMAYRLEVDEAGAHVRQGTFDRRYAWLEVRGFEETRDALTLSFVDGFFVTVPARAFPSDEARARLTELVRANATGGA